MKGRATAAGLVLLAGACAPPTRALRIEMRSEADRAHLVRGWSGFEGADGPTSLRFCWVEGTSSKVEVGRPARAGTARLRIRAWPFAFPGLPEQTVQLWVNSMYVGTRVMTSEPVEYEWAFPAALFQRGGNDLYLLFGRANRPSDVIPGNGDTRELAAAVEFLELTTGR